jgi:hypothetical protein
MIFPTYMTAPGTVTPSFIGPQQTLSLTCLMQDVRSGRGGEC